MFTDSDQYSSPCPLMGMFIWYEQERRADTIQVRIKKFNFLRELQALSGHVTYRVHRTPRPLALVTWDHYCLPGNLHRSTWKNKGGPSLPFGAAAQTAPKSNFRGIRFLSVANGSSPWPSYYPLRERTCSRKVPVPYDLLGTCFLSADPILKA